MSRQAGDQLIAERARSQVQTFFDELKNGTSNYRTIDNLDAQIAQEYRGRCILELLQNAHDALANAGPDDPRRISFVLSTDPDPVLLVGNSGTPFRQDDFEGICQLAHSPKDPNESIGNKGLGFRSVLEVSSCPEIWSTVPVGSSACFAFRFDPVVIEQVAEAAQDLDRFGLHARSPFDPTCLLVDWSQDQLGQYRQQLAGAGIDAAVEAGFLSPYLIPLRAEQTPAEVRCLMDEGHVTVIRLPLDHGTEAVQSVQEQLKALQDAQSLIFLERLASLVVEVDGDRRTLDRAVESEVSLVGVPRTRQRRLRVSTTTRRTSDADARRFDVWTRAVGGDDDPDGAEGIRAAVESLPNRWPEVRQASVGLAVEDALTSAEGVFVIFLPTEKTTGTGAHVNAPFYGSLNRRQINFDEPYNKILLQNVEDLCLDAVRELTTAQPEGWRARAVVDILSSTNPVGDEPWRLVTKLCERAIDQGFPLGDQPVVLCDGGWNTPAKARVMPNLDGDDPIGIDRWREQAGFAVVSMELDFQMDSVRRLINDLDGEPDPTDLEWADTIGRLAQHVQESSSVHWNAFFRSLLAILPDDLRSESRYRPDRLANARFLPSADGRLLTASESTKLFFQPAQDDEDAVLVERVPEVLRRRVAFLHPDVRTHEGQQGRNTEVQKFLDGRFASTFRRADILERVVAPAVPSLPVPHGSSDANDCAAILEWTLKLIGEDPPPGLLPSLRQLPVCCHGGWFPLEDASFGPGWPDRHGDDIQVLASELADEAAQQLMGTMLLPPDDERWQQVVVEGRDQLLDRLGVTDGLRLQAIDIDFHMAPLYSDLDKRQPAGVLRESWTDWVKSLDMQPRHVQWHPYKLSGVLLLPVLHYFAELKAIGRNALSRLILASLAHWPTDWQSVVARKTYGQDWTQRVTSPLKHWLQTTPWLGEHGEGAAQLLSSRWLVPESLLRGQAGLFSHLDPLTLDLAHRLNIGRSLREQLLQLGLNVYPAESDDMIGPELLGALAKAWTDNKVSPARFDVFLGQVRHGWQHLDPDRGLPSMFLVRAGLQRGFLTLGHDELRGVYLPDDPARTRTLRDHDERILEMRVEEARDMADVLLEATDVGKASVLEERYAIDGVAWDEPAEGIAALDQTRYEWLSVVLLAIHAHGGNRTGADTASWRNAANRLRRARVRECDEISVELVDDGRAIAASRPTAAWLPGDVLAIRRSLASYEELAEAAQALLDRQDLLIHLRLTLGALSIQSEVTPDLVKSALGRANIDIEALADIRQRWMGNTSLLVDRIRPVLTLLGIPSDSLDATTVDVDRLTEWLSTNLRQWPTPALLAAARKSPDDHVMGTAAWNAMGSVAQLPAWNAALSKLGSPYETVENRDVSEQTKHHIEEATTLLRGFARHVAVHVGDANLFHLVENVTQAFSGDSAWAAQWWEVPFSAVVDALCNRYAEISGVKPFLGAFEDVETVDDLYGILQTQGIEIAPDPYETAERNKNELEIIYKDVRDLHRTWMELQDAGAQEHTQPPPADVQQALPAMAYLRRWSDAELLKMALEVLDDQGFTSACDGCATLDAIRSRLNLTSKAVEARREARRAREREAERARRTFVVAGEPFEVGGDESYHGLFHRLDQLPVPSGPSARRDEFTPLAKVRVRTNRRGDRGAPGEGRVLPTPRPSAQSRDLIGIVGEMHAYRYLRKEFGEMAVTRGSWVSEIRRNVIPPLEGEPHDVNDAHGFDFRFTHKRKTWHVEVKATIADDLHFDLGVSEIRAANELARKRGGRWRILRVRRALTDSPEFDWLPNPFEDEYRQFYRLHQGGMQISYSRKSTVKV